MEDSPKTGFQLNNSDVSLLQNSFKKGNLIPVRVLAKLSALNYSIRIKNITLNAFSELDLLNKSILVRVKELFPVPVLQLIFVDEENSLFDNPDLDSLDSFNAQDLILMKKFLHLFKSNSVKNLTALLNFLKIKQFYNLIPLNIHSELDKSDCLPDFLYNTIHINNSDIPNGFLDLSITIENILSDPSQKEIALLFQKNLHKNNTHKLAYLAFKKENSTILIPFEAQIINKNLKKISSYYKSTNFGDICINGSLKSEWHFSLSFENITFLNSFKNELPILRKTLLSNHNIPCSLSCSLFDYSVPEQNYNTINVYITG